MLPFDRVQMTSYSTLIKTMHRFSVIASYLSKVANFNLSHLYLAPPLGMTTFEFCRDFRRQQSRALIYHVALCV